jgi:hypothetical protein
MGRLFLQWALGRMLEVDVDFLSFGYSWMAGWVISPLHGWSWGGGTGSFTRSSCILDPQAVTAFMSR